MGLFAHEYPYTDMHELNLDWIISEVNRLNQNLDEIERKAVEESVAATREFVDRELSSVMVQFEQLKALVEQRTSEFDAKTRELDVRYNAFVTQVGIQLQSVDARIERLRTDLNAAVIGVNARTDQAIEQNNAYIFQQIGEGYADVKVINFFTGERVSIQQMFDYLASLHSDDGITYQAISSRSKTVTQMINYNKTVSELVAHGNTIIV